MMSDPYFSDPLDLDEYGEPVEAQKSIVPSTEELPSYNISSIDQEPGRTYGDTLPLSTDEQGNIRFDIAGGIVGDALRGIRTISEGARGEPVSPEEATQAMLGVTGGSVFAKAPAGALASGLMRRASPTSSIEETIKKTKKLELSDDDFKKTVLVTPSENAYAKLGVTDIEKDRAAYKKLREIPESQRQKNNPQVQEAAQKLQNNEITSADFREVVKKYLPINPFTKMTKYPSVSDMAFSLTKNQVEKHGIVGFNKTIPEGARVSSRLDINAYNNYDTWVVSLHDGRSKSGKNVGYAQAAVLKDVNFYTPPQLALNISTGKTNKVTIGRIYGDYVDVNPDNVYDFVKKNLDNPEYIQVGMNPYRASYFYDKATMQPIVSASEMYQVGPIVLVKKSTAKFASPDDPQFKINPDNPDDPRTFLRGGLMSEDSYGGSLMLAIGNTSVPEITVGYDEVSGNPIPPGSEAEEVRDDVDVLLSEGEYVLPADVVRYWGVRFLEQMRQEAKMGLMYMQMDGRLQMVDEDFTDKEPSGERQADFVEDK